MWKEVKNYTSNSKEFRDAKNYDAVFDDLIQECKHSAPGARLSGRLRIALERMRPDERRVLCSRTRDGCAPLFVACRRGNVELVEYLVHVCNADLEQRGVYEVAHDRSTHSVTPLWCAAVSGRIQVLRTLADAGADLDAGSDSGSTPVRSACFMTHLDVVKFLVERGADIHRPNNNGGTCLINSVQSVPLCAYLLQHGAQVDAYDMQHKTALHYAIQEHRLETVQLLLDGGASPQLRSLAGDDALRLACLKGAAQVVLWLQARVRYSPARWADAYELLGSTQLDEFNDVSGALSSWRRATAIRHAQGSYIEKRSSKSENGVELTRAALGGISEWGNLEELEAIADDVDALRSQALLVAARVLGIEHKDTVFRLMYRGAAYADEFRYQPCIELWKVVLRVRIETDSLLADTSQAASALTRLMLDAHAGRLERAHGLPRPRDVLAVLALLAAALPESRRALGPPPVARREAAAVDRALRCAAHLLYLLLHTASGAAERHEVQRVARELVRADVRSARCGDSLLHLCASRSNVVRSSYAADDCAPAFPDVPTVALLLRCGADPRARNLAGSTPLHVAAIPCNFSSELVETLLAGGAHLDQPNRFGDSPARLVAHNRGSRVHPLRHSSLRCLAARALLASGQCVPAAALPPSLRAFLDLHRP